MRLVVNIADNLTPFLNGKIRRLQDRRGLHKAMGFAVEALVVGHIEQEMVPRGNKLGGTSTGFWQKAVNSARTEVDGDAATVIISARGTALQYFGGVVTAKNKPWLTIPIHSMAHGRAAEEIGMPLYRFTSKAGNEILATRPTKEDAKAFRKNQNKPRGKSSARGGEKRRGYIGGIPVYVLKKSVTIPAHPEALPTMDAIAQAAADAARDFLN